MPDPVDLLPKTITRPVFRIGATAQNALEVARFGGLSTDEESSPYEVVAEQRVYRLRHYYPDSDKAAGPPVRADPADDARGRGLRRVADDERGEHSCGRTARIRG